MYDPSALDMPTVDLLVIDGPPRRTGDNARYPALPVLGDRFTAGAVAVLDDADRDDERACLERWARDRPAMVVTTLPTAKGLAVMEGLA